MLSQHHIFHFHASSQFGGQKISRQIRILNRRNQTCRFCLPKIDIIRKTNPRTFKSHRDLLINSKWQEVRFFNGGHPLPNFACIGSSRISLWFWTFFKSRQILDVSWMQLTFKSSFRSCNEVLSHVHFISYHFRWMSIIQNKLWVWQNLLLHTRTGRKSYLMENSYFENQVVDFCLEF